MVKYQAIYQDLLNKIKNKKFESNTYLPSEKELTETYDASRDTIRKALNLLQQGGYIQKNKGKGSLVLDFDRISFPVSGVTSFKELQRSMHGNVKTYVNIFLQSEVTKDIRKHLSMKRGSMYHVERIREIDGEKVILDVDYLNGDVIKGLKLEHAQNSLYEYRKKLQL